MSQLAPLILVVEDTKDIQVLVAMLLKHAGYRTLMTDKGIDAINLVREHQPAAVLLDLNIPSLPGWEVARLLEQEYPSIPIIAMTGQVSLPSHVEKLVPKATRVLIKPFEPPMLLQYLAEVLGPLALSSGHA